MVSVFEACGPDAISLWHQRLDAKRLLFVAGGEARSLEMAELESCDWRCYIESAACSHEGLTPSLNLASAVPRASSE